MKKSDLSLPRQARDKIYSGKEHSTQKKELRFVAQPGRESTHRRAVPAVRNHLLLLLRLT
jgi:hypothetical protein